MKKQKNSYSRTSSFVVTISLLMGAFFFPLIAQNTTGGTTGKLEKKSDTRVKKTTLGPSCNRKFRVDFRDKDIQDFLKAMSKTIGRNIITDDRVKGKITVISPNKISVCDAYAYLTSVLAIKGFAIIDDGILLKVVPMKDAAAKGDVILIGRGEIDEQLLKDNKVITHVLTLNNHKPSRLAGILKRISSPNLNIVDYDEVGTMIMTGEADEINRILEIVNELDPKREDDDDESKPHSENVHIYRLQNLQAEKLEQTLRRVRLPEKTVETPETKKKPNERTPQARQPRTPANRGSQTSTIEVIAHKESNSIIFIGTYAEFKPISDLIKQIDIPRDQVLLEVLIIEVAQNDSNSFGIDWRVQTNGSSGQFSTGTVKKSGIGITKGSPDVLSINSLDGFSLGFLTGNSNGLGLGGLIEANVDNENFAIISAPQILTLDNQEAEINVGEDIPIISGNRVSGGSNDQVDYFTYEYKSVGVKVKFTPHINKNGMVTLDLYQEVKSAIVPEDTTLNPTFTKRDIKTSVRVADGQTIVIGGLVSTRKTKTERKIPILGDIPILGYLFKRTGTVINKTNLLVFITPHVLTNRQVADDFTNESVQRQEKEFEKINTER
ncbi:MAG: secretin N-terminal domain-containing protein [Leptospirales bacterium]